MFIDLLDRLMVINQMINGFQILTLTTRINSQIFVTFVLAGVIRVGQGRSRMTMENILIPFDHLLLSKIVASLRMKMTHADSF